MSQSSKEVVQAFFKAMETKDYDTALKFVSEDLEYINGPNPPRHGPQGVRDELEPAFAAVERNEFIIHREGSSGGIVFQERLDRHKVAQGWIELPVTGVLEVKQGKIVYWRDYFDSGVLNASMASVMSTDN